MDYSAREVSWLLGLSREDAIDCDGPRLSLSQTDGGGDGGELVPTIARWTDVQRARRAVAGRRRAGREALEAELYSQGYTQDEIAEELGSSQRSVGRHVRSFVDDVLVELHGNAYAPALGGA